MINDKDKKIGIINHWMVNNYGALFLAYAIEKGINKLGYNNVETITYLPDEVQMPWKLSMAKKVGLLTYLLRLGYFMVFILPREKSFANMRSKMNTSKENYNDKTIALIADHYDKIVIGGDQLWNCKINYYNENNFLPFVHDKKKKVVYAASIAQDNIREDLVNRFKELTEDFSYITTREQRATEIIEEITNLKAPRVADPAFLLTAREWEMLAEKDDCIIDKYIFVYQVQSDTELINFAKKLSENKKLKIVYCPFPLKKQIKCKRHPYMAPEKWLWYVKNADYVVTDAFHGTVFSIIFNRPFFSQISNYGKDTGSRITNLLNVFSLESRLLVNGNCDFIDGVIDFKKVNNKINEEREFSMQHLNKMLG